MTPKAGIDRDSNMEWYNEVRKPPATALKRYHRAGFDGTAIDHQWRIEVMTQTFGPVGQRWGVEITKRWREECYDRELFFVTTRVWYRVSAKGEQFWTPECCGGTMIHRSGGLSADEGYKAAETDAFGKALQYLGLGADVYAGQMDADKYTRESNHPPASDSGKRSSETSRQAKPASSEPAPKVGTEQPATQLPSHREPAPYDFTSRDNDPKFPPENTWVPRWAPRGVTKYPDKTQLGRVTDSDLLVYISEYPKLRGFGTGEYAEKNIATWKDMCLVALARGLALPYEMPVPDNEVASSSAHDSIDPGYGDDDEAPF